MFVDDVGRMVVALGAWFLGPILRRVWTDDDDETQFLRKAAYVGTSVAVLVSIPTHLIATLVASGTEGNEYYLAGMLFAAAVSLFNLAYLLAVKHAGDVFCAASMVTWLLAIFLIDLQSAMSVRGIRGMFLSVVALDICLVARLGVANYILLAVLGWVTLMESELLFRFGLLDLPLSPSAESRRAVCDCAEPPCGMPFDLTLRSYVFAIFIFVMDFALTLYFANSVREERDKMTAAVATTQAIAECFARFDLARASEILEVSELPDDLERALSAIFSNLNSYRPYLPSALFEFDVGSHDVPGANGSGVAVVFTDIRASTKLWECSGDAMDAALTVHNTIIREAIAAFDGYEVKTIGDAFMVAFANAGSAVAFGLDVQRSLSNAEWPRGLSRGEIDEYDLLMVRVGVHCGQASVKQNPATGRFDYFGGTVNMAARVEANGAPGAVTVTPEVLEAVGSDPAVLEGVVQIAYADAREAKGFAKKVQFTALLPSGIARYIPIVRAHCAAEQPQRTCSIDSAGDRRSSTPVSTPSSPGVMPPFAAPKAMGTLCVLRLRAVEDIQQLGPCLAGGEGRIATVFGEYCVMSWGAARNTAPARAHFDKAVAFLLDLQGKAPGFCAGVASGMVTKQHLSASATQRFITVGGPCVPVALSLCEGAAALGASVLAASLDPDVGAENAAGEGDIPLRPVDLWDVNGCVTQVYDIPLSGTSGDAAAAFCAAYHAGDADALRQIAEGDAVLAAAARLSERGGHLQHASVAPRPRHCD
eukprot:TRINITY_DN801_c5_g1_i1.p1 TRINITY_DN801_c5_g1~~TRINITY_DN801_c5_g1_i1.p1  ORF type:complete len:762 (+),score=184.25 TRINITY_DN801_c5_g1_i1:60-2345(+)